jgi:outer membrane protein TolC
MVWCVRVNLVFCAALPLNAQEATTEPLRLTLTDAIDLALHQGFEARAVEAMRDASRYRHDAFYSRLLPQFSLSATVPAFNRSIIEVLQPDGSTQFRSQNQTTAEVGATVSQVIPFTGGDVFVSSSLTRISVSGAQEALTWSSTPVTIGLRQPIFRPNSLGWDKRAQPVRTEVAEREYLEAREDLALRTTGLFFDVHAAQVMLETALANVGVNDTLFTLNKGRYEIGRIGENDLLQSELALLRAQTDLDAAKLELQRALAAFRIALNIAPDTPLEIDVPASVPDLEPDTAVAVKEALQNTSAIASLELQNVQAKRRVAEAKLENGVGALLQASYGFNATGSRFKHAYQDLLEAQQLTLSVEIPLIQWGARRAQVRAAEMDLDQVASTTQATLDQAAHEARFAARRVAQARRALALSGKADTVAQKRFEVAYNRYVIGRISIDNLFIAQREKDQASQQYVRALRAYWEAYYWLRRVTLYDFERGRVITGR